jgi:hypothetical protein
MIRSTCRRRQRRPCTASPRPSRAPWPWPRRRAVGSAGERRGDVEVGWRHTASIALGNIESGERRRCIPSHRAKAIAEGLVRTGRGFDVGPSELGSSFAQSRDFPLDRPGRLGAAPRRRRRRAASARLCGRDDARRGEARISGRPRLPVSGMFGRRFGDPLALGSQLVAETVRIFASISGQDFGGGLIDEPAL